MRLWARRHCALSCRKGRRHDTARRTGQHTLSRRVRERAHRRCALPRGSHSGRRRAGQRSRICAVLSRVPWRPPRGRAIPCRGRRRENGAAHSQRTHAALGSVQQWPRRGCPLPRACSRRQR
eukprot:Amastigsp_a340411_13.p4 type:complete len:122 gc:universal Amastigsp_a340411_13:1237-872(-)